MTVNQDIETEAPTGEFEWAGLISYRHDGDGVVDEVHAIRTSGNYYHVTVLETGDRVDLAALGDRPEDFELVGPVGWADFQSDERPYPMDDVGLVYATEDGSEWLVHDLQKDLTERTEVTA
jgi:hypothetical protein